MLIDPRYIVASQLKTLMADGIDTLKVKKLKMALKTPDIFEVNIW